MTGIDDPATRHHIPQEGKPQLSVAKTLNTGLLRWMLAWRLVYRETKGAGRDSRGRSWPGLLCAQNPGIFTTLGNTIFPFRRTLPSDGWPQCPLCACTPWKANPEHAYSYTVILSLYISLSLSGRGIALHKALHKEDVTASRSQN